MQNFNETKTPRDHIQNIFEEYTTPSRVLRSFNNLSNTVIETALSGQSKFVLEILQNADDSFEDPYQVIEATFMLQNNLLIVHHNGKGFSYNDVERICDYASQIEEVKANDLSKTGYKGLGFKSLFNLSDCIYIYSNGYSFRFDKSYWLDPGNHPWQVIPIWCEYEELPQREHNSYNHPVNFILKVNQINQLQSQLQEIVHHPDMLMFLRRINKITINLNGDEYSLERKIKEMGEFRRIDLYKNKLIESTWISRTFEQNVPVEVKQFMEGASRFIYPEKIKNAEKVPFTFALRTDQSLSEITKIRGLIYNALPTQLHLTFPYHINGFFILNLDRTQLHENEWNEFLLQELAHLQFSLLKDIATVENLKDYVLEILVRGINHPYNTFCKVFMKSFSGAKIKIAWIPSHQQLKLLKLPEAWVDETEFFKQNFKNIQDKNICPYLIDYDVKGQNKHSCSHDEINRFTLNDLLRDFRTKYYPQLTKTSYLNFITYLYKKFSACFDTLIKDSLFLVAKNGMLVCPKDAVLEERIYPEPSFSALNPINNDYLPSSDIKQVKKWLINLGARRLTPDIILQESVLKWIDSGFLNWKLALNNHVEIIEYIAKNVNYLQKYEFDKIKENLLILTESNQFKLAKLCSLPDAIPIKELYYIIPDDKKVSSCYNLSHLKKFFIDLGVHSGPNSINIFHELLQLISKNELKNKLTVANYIPVIEYLANNYWKVKLKPQEEQTFKEMPVLTCAKSFQKAKDCYFDSAILNVKGLEGIIASNELVTTNHLSRKAKEFLLKIGVSETMSEEEVITRSVLKWIWKGDIESRVNKDNHYSILKYISDKWNTLYDFFIGRDDWKYLKEIPILTMGNTFRPAYKCYFPDSIKNYDEKIPSIDNIISSNESVSTIYNFSNLEEVFGNLGVRCVELESIYKKYSDHLNSIENMQWFFSHLVRYWNNHHWLGPDQLLLYVAEKLKHSSQLLGKNGKMYYSTELYSSKFKMMHDIDPNVVPLLYYERLPEKLEIFLGFITELELTCITHLLETIRTNPEKGTSRFFKALLEQLRLKNKSEIQNYQLSLLSKDNKLKPAKQLYYFIEEDSSCVLEYCYLKRIHGMSHDETLELAKLCGVNTLPYEGRIVREKATYDDSLRRFYLERLALIVLQESKELNENFVITLSRLFRDICSIELYQCEHIYANYPFGTETEMLHYFDKLTIYVTGKWNTWKYKSHIHYHIKEQLDLKSDVALIMDMEPVTHIDKQEWLRIQKEDLKKFELIEAELQKLLSKSEVFFSD